MDIPTAVNEAVAQKLGPNRKKYYETGDDDSMLHHPSQISWEVIPDYCTDIKAAWEIVESFPPKPQCYMTKFNEHWIVDIGNARGEADTAPMAICLAFLKI